ncbi:MAG: hypothetical protein KAS72_01545 [Phycisphaerales bacterium]|nr:hypothetical protein [Phycisphaerales bacterium]
MSAKTVVIGLESDHVDVVVLDGTEQVARKYLSVELEFTSTGFISSLRAIRSVVAETITELGAEGLGCIVYYRSPSSTVELVSSPTKNLQAAFGAARLALGEALSCALDAAVFDTVLAARDARGQTAHVIAAGERSEIARAIADLVTAVGLRPVGCSPIDVPLVRAVTSRVVGSSDRDLRGHAYLGERCSVFAVGHHGKLLLFRRIGFSLSQLVEAAMKAAPTGNAAVSREQARSWLTTFGVPDRDDVIDADRGLTGASLRPLMQPVLQRLVTEVRQSLRFGVPEELRTEVELKLTGPGSGIPNLADLLSHELGLAVTADDSMTSGDDEFSLCLADAPQPLVSVLPEELATAGRNARIKKQLWIGAAAAGLLVAVDALMLEGKLSDAEQVVARLEMTRDQEQRLSDSHGQLFAAAQASHRIENMINRELEAQAPSGALLKALSRITPPDIRLTSIEFQIGEEGPIGTLVGYAIDINGRNGGEAIRDFIGRLQELPAIGEASLASAQEMDIDDMHGRQFRLDLKVQGAALLLKHTGLIGRSVAGGSEVQP